jgi:hypothetical protein
MCFCCAHRAPSSSFGAWLYCSGPVHGQNRIHLSPRAIGSGATAWRKRVPDLLGDSPRAVWLPPIDVQTSLVLFNGLAACRGCNGPPGAVKLPSPAAYHDCHPGLGLAASEGGLVMNALEPGSQGGATPDA